MEPEEVIEKFSYSVFLDPFIIVGLTLLSVFLVRFGLKKIISTNGNRPWLKLFAEAMYAPIQWILVGFGLLVLIQNLGLYFETLTTAVDLPFVRKLYLYISVFFLLLVWQRKLTEEFLRKAKAGKTKKVDKAVVLALSRLASISIFILGGFLILDLFQVPLTAFVAFGGVGGLAISFSASDVIKNFFGGLMIYVNRHFSEGEWIRSPNKNFEGVVENIGWYMTKIRTFDRRPTYIPNALMTDAIVENPSRMYNRRIKKDIGIRYEDFNSIVPIVDEIREMLQNHPDIDQNQFLMVEFHNFGAYSLDINIYTFTKTTNWQKWRTAQQDVLIKAGQIIEKHGAQIAFPTTTVQLEQSTSPEKRFEDLSTVSVEDKN